MQKEQDEIGNLVNMLKNEYDGESGNNEGDGSGGENEDIVRLEVGSTVIYNPSGTYNWQAKYCSSDQTETTDDLTLNSSEANFKISEWKVLSIDETTGKVELVPSCPTTGTVYLGQAQGYNNGVKLLNDACSNLYGNKEKGIMARSINIEDIEKYMTQEALTGENGAHKYTDDGTVQYGNQASSACTDWKSYPVIYAKEKKAVINASTPTDATLDLSDTLDRFIERTENGAIAGELTASTSIHPYLTYWYKDATFMETAFQEYTKKDNTKANYYKLIIPQGIVTAYWVASRCVYVSDLADDCIFSVRDVHSGNVDAYNMCHSDMLSNYSGSLALFPVISLSSELVKSGTDGTFAVSLE